MNQNKCFGVIVKSCSVTPREVRVFKLKTGLYIIAWNKCKLTVFETTSNFIIQNGNNEPDNIKDKENRLDWEFTLDHNIVNVIQKDETIFVVDAIGSLFQFDVCQDFEMETNQLTEVDMFGGSPLPVPSDHHTLWKLNKTGKLEDCDTVLAVCSVEIGFAVLATKRGHVYLLVYKLLKFFPSAVIEIVTHNKQEVIRGGVIGSCLPKRLSPELRNGLLKGLQSDDREILLLGLSNGEIMWVPVNSGNRGPYTVYCAVQLIQNFHWISDGGSDVYSRLVIILRGGPVIIIQAEQNSVTAHTLFLPSRVVSSACVDNRIVTTDAVDCLLNVLCLEEEKLKVESSVFPVKGVTALYPVVEQKHLFIAGTMHRCVYYVDSEVTPAGDPRGFSMPNQSVLDELFNKIQQLEDVNKLMSKEDLYLKAISLTTRAHLLKDAFHINAKVFTVSGIDRRLIVFITINTAYKFIELSADLWCVNIQLRDTDSNSWSQTQYLQHNLAAQASVVVEMNCTVRVGSTLTCRFMSVIEGNQPQLVIPAGEVLLDACYFLTPVGNLICTLPPEEPDLNSVLLALAGKSENVEASEECNLNVRVPENIELNDVFPIIFKDSQHRMSINMWQNLNCGKQRVVHLLTNRTKVQLNLDDATRTLTISSMDIDTSYQMKSAIVRHFTSDKHVHIDESLILEAQAILQSLEIEMLKETQSFEFYDNLRKRVRTEISSKLPL